MPEPAAPLHLLDATMFWNPGGGVRRYIGAKRRFVEQRCREWRHTVVTPMPDGSGQRGVPSLPLPGSSGAYRLPWRRAAAARVLCDARPDLIEAADPWRLAWSALDAAQTLGVPAVAFCHSNVEQLARFAIGGRAGAVAARLARRYATHLYRHFDLVLAPSHAMTAHLRDWGVERARHQPLGVDATLFDPGRASAAWRASLGLPDDARLLVFAGRFAPEKNLATLAAAVQRLGPRYWLLAIGAGPAPPRGDRVLIQPLVRDVETLATMMASCDLFMHAGAQETFGLSVLEALACGVPVVARAAEGLTELVDGSVGCGVASGDPAEFAEAVRAVLEGDRQSLACNARQRAVLNDWQQVLPRLWQQYGQLLNRPSLAPALQ